MSYNSENIYRKHKNLSVEDRQNLRDTRHRNQESLEFYKMALVAENYFVKGYKVGNEQALKVSPHKNFKKIIEKLCEKYPTITVDKDVIGEPRLAGTRFAVSNVLTAFTNSNSLEEIIDEYEDRYTEKQLKDALRFARDFLDSFYTS